METKRAPLLALLAFSILGCKGYQKISGAEFQKQYELRDQQTTARAEYLGTRERKAFLRVKRMSTTDPANWKETIVCAELDELDPALRSDLTAHGREFSGEVR